MTDETVKELGLLKALNRGPVICAEGYLFEMERRGYLKANLFVPEVVLDNPRALVQLHRDFVHAGSDVVLAFTYGCCGTSPYHIRAIAEALGRRPEASKYSPAELTEEQKGLFIPVASCHKEDLCFG